MTMDVFALHEGLNAVHLCRPPRGKHHVDGYLRMSYLGDEELLVWVRENFQAYAYRHVLGMLTQIMAGSVMGSSSKRLKDAVALIDSLYDTDTLNTAANGFGQTGSVHSSSGNTLSNLLSTRLREDSKLSSLITGKFRR